LAVFTDGVLTGAYVVRAKGRFDGLEAYWGIAKEVRIRVGDLPDILIVETPQQYSRSPAPRSSIQVLEGVIGALVAVFAPCRTVPYFPREWKGQLPKAVAFTRILSRLTPTEMLVEPNLFVAVRYPTSMWGHVVDAVGVGLHHLGRFGSAPKF